MAATTIPGLSTLGVIFAYGVETTAGTKPATFTTIERCNSIDGITVENEQIDASALEDALTKRIPGRGDPGGGTWNVTFNYTNDVKSELSTMISAYTTGKASGFATWFEVYHPNLTDSFFVVASPPPTIPMPTWGQNDLLTVEIGFTIVDYKGPDTAVTPTAP